MSLNENNEKESILITSLYFDPLIPTNENLWNHCTDLYIQARNGNTQSVIELEELSKNDDLICMGYYFLLLGRCSELNDKEKSANITQKLTQKVRSIINHFLSNNNDDNNTNENNNNNNNNNNDNNNNPKFNFESISFIFSNLINTQEQFVSGCIFEFGVGVEKNLEEAFRLYKLSAESGFTLAESMIGYCLSQGYGVAVDPQLSVEYYMRAVNKGFSVAQSNIGLCYEKGHGVQQDYSEAIRYYLMSASQGYINAQNNLGRCYEYGIGVPEDYSMCFYWFKKSADRGDANGQHIVGWCYLYGKGVEKDEEEGIKWYIKSANQEYSRAQYYLGEYYLKKSEDSSKFEEGYELQRRAAENGLPEAQYSIGLKYYCGSPTIQVNEEEAIKWFQLSAEQGYWKGLSTISKFLHYGNMLKRNRRDSIKYLERALAGGSPNVKYSHCLYCIQDVEEPSNQKKGLEYLKKLNSGSTQQYVDVMMSIGMCHEYGLGGVEVIDNKESFRWYLKSSNGGHGPGQYKAARCYEEGNGVVVNIAEAKRLFELSANLGDIDAKNKLREYEEDKVDMMNMMRMNKRMKYESK